jgi:hypothetical protein
MKKQKSEILQNEPNKKHSHTKKNEIFMLLKYANIVIIKNETLSKFTNTIHVDIYDNSCDINNPITLQIKHWVYILINEIKNFPNIEHLSMTINNLDLNNEDFYYLIYQISKTSIKKFEIYVPNNKISNTALYCCTSLFLKFKKLYESCKI